MYSRTQLTAILFGQQAASPHINSSKKNVFTKTTSKQGKRGLARVPSN